MAFQGVGDLAQSFQLRRDNARLQETFRILSNELSSGRKSDLGQAVSGDFGALAGIERSLRAITAFETAASETQLMADAAQSTLDFISQKSSAAAGSLLLADADFQSGLVGPAVESAGRAFEDVVSALNIRVGDRTVFGGIATDRAAIADPETMLVELETLIAAETTAAGVVTVVTDWFGPGGGYETLGYLGDANTLSNIPISQDERVDLDVSAADPGVRDVLAGLAIGALLDRGALSAEPVERGNLAQSAGTVLLQSEYGLTQTRARVGGLQERVDDAITRNGTERQMLDIARASIVEADPYETAAQLAALEVQLETLYAVTARLSRLTLTDFVR